MIVKYSSLKTVNTKGKIVVSIPLKLTNKYTPLLIGKGIEPGLNIRETLSLPIIESNIVNERFIIPSSSIKGVFRKTSIAIMKTCIKNADTCIFVKHDTDIVSDLIKRSISTHDEDKGRHATRENISEIEEVKNILYNTQLINLIDRYCIEVVGRSCSEAFKEPRSVAEESSILELLISLFCPICSLYGSTVYASSIAFKPIALAKADKHPRTRTAVNRSTRTIEKGMLFTDYTVVIRDTHGLKLEFIIKDLEPGSPAARLLASTLDYFRIHGIHMGGGKSIGYGLLQLSDEETKWYHVDYSVFKDYLKPKIKKGLTSLIEYLLKP